MRPQPIRWPLVYSTIAPRRALLGTQPQSSYEKTETPSVSQPDAKTKVNTMTSAAVIPASQTSRADAAATVRAGSTALRMRQAGYVNTHRARLLQWYGTRQNNPSGFPSKGYERLRANCSVHHRNTCARLQCGAVRCSAESDAELLRPQCFR